MAPLPHVFLDPRNAGDAGCDRSLWSIIWGCFLTLFACTWVAIHPDAASAKDSGSTILARRIGMMLGMLLAPELVIGTAFGEWTHAVYYSDKFALTPGGVEWTQTHSYFLLMGGFSYYDEEGKLEVLKAKKIEELYEKGLIEWPTVTVKDIRDHSKADFLSKFIVIIQTSWFSLQIVVRLASGLTATELEVSTFAFAILNVIAYALWWNKPFNVWSPIVIPGKNSPSPRCKPATLASIRVDSDPLAEAKNTINSVSVTPESDPLPTPEVHQNDCTPFLVDTTSNTFINPEPRSDFQISLGLAVLGLSGFWTTSLRTCASFLHDIGIGVSHAIIEPRVHKTSLPAPRSRPGSWWAPLAHLQLGAILLAVGVAFGAIHFIAWNFSFPTATEMWLWRSSSIALMSSTLTIFGLFLMGNTLDKGGIFSTIAAILAFISTVIYVLARIFLLILPLITLRDPAPGVFVNIHWTSLLPHF
ncbi:hypothetical protein BJ165DRAFT_649081 [Panaeolus papilionaceus]|nr:hypothetical protein BJ165DRAFT_649081 [Panaeolus papilionaceus]